MNQSAIKSTKAVLTLQLRTKRGYSCDARHEITDGQWEAINAILNEEAPQDITNDARKIRRGLDLANTLSCDVPITLSARNELRDAYEALDRLQGKTT